MARFMAAVDVVVALVLLHCCSLAQGAPERAPAFRLEVTSEHLSCRRASPGRRAAGCCSSLRAAGACGGWFEGLMGYLGKSGRHPGTSSRTISVTSRDWPSVAPVWLCCMM